jgi:hypothetical protein
MSKTFLIKKAAAGVLQPAPEAAEIIHQLQQSAIQWVRDAAISSDLGVQVAADSGGSVAPLVALALLFFP